MKENILEQLNKRLIKSYPLKESNGGYRDGLRDAMKIVSLSIETQSKVDESFPPMTDNPLLILFTSHGYPMYKEVGRLSSFHENGIEFGNKIYKRI